VPGTHLYESIDIKERLLLLDYVDKLIGYLFEEDEEINEENNLT